MNIAEILNKIGVRGMELYSPIFGKVYLDKIRPHLAIVVTTDKEQGDFKEEFLYDGRYGMNGECMLFPSKENRDWNTFQKSFEDGDVITCSNSACTFVSIFKDKPIEKSFRSYCSIILGDNNLIVGMKYGDYANPRFASKEEKQKLFDAIEANGYIWNAETKILKKLDFKSGDVLVSRLGNIVLCDYIDNKQIVHYHCILDKWNSFIIRNDIGVGKACDCTRANNTQKQRLFDKLSSSGYIYNPLANKLEKKYIVPKFKVGDRVRLKSGGKIEVINAVTNKYHLFGGGSISLDDGDKWELVPDKFDITTLKPFDKVLVRNRNYTAWRAGIYSHYTDAIYGFICANSSSYLQCIPYEDNEHLIGTTNDCNDYYKTWL